MPTAINDHGKLLVLAIGLVGSFAVAIVGLGTRNDAAMGSGLGLVGTIFGYVFGNGRLAGRREPPSPLLAPKLPTEEFVRLDELPSGVRAELMMRRLEARKAGTS